MSTLRLILASLVYHWRLHAAVACGVAAGTAVLTGALLVGDSMRGSLRHLTLDRLGRIDEVLVTERLFRAQLADQWAAQPALRDRSLETVPAILLRASLENPGPTQPARANQVNLLGCDARFWQLGEGGTGELPDEGEIVLNEPLAEHLGVRPGDDVLVRLPHLSAVPAENALGRKTETVRTSRLKVRAIIPAQGLGRFTLRPSQQLPRNAYVSLAWLQDRLEKPGWANAIFVAGTGQSPPSPAEEAAVVQALHPSLEDYGIRVEKTRRGYFNVSSERMIFEPAVEQAIRKALENEPCQPALTYLANAIALRTGDKTPVALPKGAVPFSSNENRDSPPLDPAPIPKDREVPYSTITAVDFTDRAPLGPMLTPEGKPIEPIEDGEIVLNAWAADDLGAKPGDTIRVRYFEPESSQGQPKERAVELRLAAIVQLAGAAADPDFTPEVPGVTDQLSISDWDPPFPFDARRVRTKDDQYWQDHRGTPKAFVSLATGRRLWASRFGQTTSLRIAPGEGISVERLKEKLVLEPGAMGFVVQPVKRQGLAASAGTTPFEGLFLGFSLFLIAAAVMLVALLFRLGIDRRAAEIGLLSAVGLRRRQVIGLLSVEGLVVAAIGSLLGILAGISYAALMLAGLRTWWLAAVVTPFLHLCVTPLSLAVGYASGLIAAFSTIAWSARRIGQSPPRQLLSGQAMPEVHATGSRRRIAAAAVWSLLAGAVGVGLLATRLGQEAQAGAFFGAGAMVLGAALILVRSQLIAGRTGPAVAVGRGNLLRLSLRSAARNPGRSTLTIGLVAAASFLIVAVSAFRLDPSQQGPDIQSGNGGFALAAESDQPIYHDLNTAEGRNQLGFSPDDSQLLARAQTIALRVRPGDDASCLNLYRPQQPRLLGVPHALIQRGGFAWAGYRASDAAIGEGTPNPWRLLELDLGTDPDGVPRVPAVLEKNTANYSLHLWKGVGETYDIPDGRGGKLRLEIVGLLSGSIFQGDLLISETAFLRHFPQQTGYRFFLVETSPEETAGVQRALERTLGDFGLATETTGQRLAGFLAVQNTYLSTFQSLGGLGLLLGTFGLAAVQLRSVLERRRELAVMRATGFSRRMLAELITLENGTLLGVGLGCGVLAALIAVLPHLFGGGAAIPWASLAGTLLLVFVVGLLAGLAAVWAALSTPLLAALRSE
jgi:putative ABC transport system permease protein